MAEISIKRDINLRRTRFSLQTKTEEDSEILIKTNKLDSEGRRLTHRRVVGVGEALVHPLPHEHPGVVGEGALDDLVVVLFQLFTGLRGQKR